MKITAIVSAALIMAAATACTGGKTGSVSIKTSKDSLSYAIGVSMGSQLKSWGFLEADIDPAVVTGGMKDAFLGDQTKISAQEAGEAMQQYLMVVIPKRNRDNSIKFLEEAQKEAGAQVTPSGIVYVIVEEGNVDLKPTLQDTVTVDYEGKLFDGKVFDSSIERGVPATYPLNGVIDGWKEGMQLVGEGGHIKLWIPSNLAYGEYGSGPIGSNQALFFDVTLKKVDRAK